MNHYDVFNGDADGICALQQLRLARPRASVLVTGLKRDIALLQRVPAQRGDSVTVLDVSLARNRAALEQLLARGVRVEYFDHHHADALPDHPGLRLFIDTAPGVCTSMLVDRHLGGARREWAVVGAFGDNLPQAAEALARAAGLPEADVEPLRELGEALNYNAYGDSESDVLLPPAAVFERVRPHASPRAFLREDPLGAALAARRREDLARAQALAPAERLAGATVYLLPDEAWARRVQGAFANVLGRHAPGHAHAVLRCVGPGAFMVNVRAPQRAPRGADALCLRFPGGGGRAAAAGIDRLPRERLGEFLAALAAAWPQAA